MARGGAAYLVGPENEIASSEAEGTQPAYQEFIRWEKSVLGPPGLDYSAGKTNRTKDDSPKDEGILYNCKCV